MQKARKPQRSSHEPVQAHPLEVVPRQGEHPERMIKRFMKKVRNDGILQELYLRKGYEKPSEKRRRRQAKSRFNRMVEEKRSTEKN